MITGEEIKSAISKKLKEKFPNVAVYKQDVTNPTYPNFSIQQVTLTSESDTRRHYMLNYFMNVVYREADNLSTVDRLNTKLDQVGIEMLEALNIIDVNGKPKRAVTGAYFESVDGMVMFFVNYKVYAELPKTPDENMEKLIENNVKVKE